MHTKYKSSGVKGSRGAKQMAKWQNGCRTDHCENSQIGEGGNGKERTGKRQQGSGVWPKPNEK